MFGPAREVLMIVLVTVVAAVGGYCLVFHFWGRRCGDPGRLMLWQWHAVAAG
jgi:hypothetical protein